MSALTISAALVILVAVTLGIVGWSSGWFGGKAPETSTHCHDN